MNTSSYNKNLNNLPVGFFDSGVGGLSVYSRFRKLMPNENTLYFGDLIHLPYGSKTKEELVGYARAILDFYETTGVKAVVIACNTSSAQAYDEIKSEYNFPIYPIIQSSAKVIAGMGAKKIGVFATEATVKSKVYTKELLKYNKDLAVKEIACPKWVGMVESGEFDRNDIKNQIRLMQEFEPDKIVLGCTHYPYLLSALSEFLPKETFIDPAEIFVNFIKSDLEAKNLVNSNTESTEKIYVSASPNSFVENAKIFYQVKDLPEVCAL